VPRSDVVRHRERILAVAGEVLRTDPRAGLVTIAEAAGLTRTTMYAHFPSRAALVDAVLTAVLADAAAAWDGRGPHPSATAAVEDHLRGSWRAFAEQGGLVVAGLDVLGPDRVRELHEPLRERVRDLVDRGRAEGDIDPAADPDWLVRTWSALVHAAGDRLRETPDALDAVTADLVGTVRRAWSPGCPGQARVAVTRRYSHSMVPVPVSKRRATARRAASSSAARAGSSARPR
jgi:AcrR family transcriptional regulator